MDAAKVQEMQMAACANLLTGDTMSRLLTGKRYSCLAILDAWKAECGTDLAPDTLANYETMLHQFLEEHDYGDGPISSVHRGTMAAWVNAKGVAVGSRKARLAALRSYYAFASAAGYCVGNPAKLICVKLRDLFFDELERKVTAPITHEEYERLMASQTLRGFYRWATALAYWTGLRLRDVACLEWASFKEDRLIVHTRKTGKRVSLPIDDPLLGGGELRGILLEMLEQPQTDPRFCFPAMREVALDTKRRALLSVQFQRVLQRHGIKGKRYHGLRHACAVRLKQAGRTLEDIAQTLGHSSTDTTVIYTNHP